MINNKEAATIDDIENLSLSVTKQTFFSLNLNSLVSQLAAGTGYKTVTISVGNSPFPIGSKYLAVSEKFLGYIQGLSSRVFSMVYVNGTTGSVGTVSIISLSQGFVSDVSLSK